MFKNFRLLFSCLLIAGCATTNVPNVGQAGYQRMDEEKRLAKRADELTEYIDDSGSVYADTELENYLTQLANSLLPETVRSQGFAVKVKVIKEPTLNAFSLPNGRIYVHLGILAATDNEAQLASLLGHEMTHILNRHALKEILTVTNKSAFLAALSTPLAIVGGELSSAFVQLTVVSSMYGYSQDLEYEADEQGFQMILEKGYDVREAPKLFEHMKEFIDEEEQKVPFFFSTHPKVLARIKNFNELINKEKNITNDGTKKVTSDDYQRIVPKTLLDQAKICLQAGLFKTAERNINKFIQRNPDDERGYYFLGELYRQRQDPVKKEKVRDKTQDYIQALEAYDKVLALQPQYSEAIKAKARVLQKQEKNDAAKEFYKQYLQLNPSAEDKQYIEQFISSP